MACGVGEGLGRRSMVEGSGLSDLSEVSERSEMKNEKSIFRAIFRGAKYATSLQYSSNHD